jgi:hypothetical protein
VNLAGITAGGGETQPLRVTASSDNTNLVLDPAVTYTADETTGSIKFTPITDATGSAVITVSVEDGGSDGDLSTSGDNATTSQTFTLTVNAVNDLPTLAAISDLTIDEDAPAQTVNLAGITAGGGETQPLRVTASSDNTNLVPSPAVTYTSDETTGSIKFTPVADASGSTVITVTVEDGGSDGNLSTSSDNAIFSHGFIVTVNPINDDPAIGVNLDNSFNQLGQSLLGYSNEMSLSGDGLTVAISPANSQYTAGWVDVYRFNSLTQSWNLLGSRLSEQVPGDAAGDSISLSEDGNTIAIGAPAHFGKRPPYYPEARVYKYDLGANEWRLTTGADSWMEQSDIVGGQGDRTGYSVSLNASGNIIAVGAISRFDKTSWPHLYGSGSIRIYEYSAASDSWNLMGLEIYGEGASDQFGTSVSISNDGHTVAVGAPKNDGNGEDAGHVRVYKYNSSTSTWNQLDGDIDGTKWRNLGSSVSISGDGLTLAVTAPVGPLVEIFRYDAPINTWQTLGAPLNIPGTFHFRFIRDLSLNDDGSRIVIGDMNAHGEDTSGSLRGGAYVYEYSESTDTWNIVDGGIYGEEPNNRSGSAVSLNNNGLSVAVLTPYYNSEYGYGQLKVFSQAMTYTMDEDASEQTVNLSGIIAGGGETQFLAVTAVSNNASLIADPTVAYTSDDATGSLKFTPLEDQNGTTTITVTVTDGGLDNDLNTTDDNLTHSETFTVAVNPVNDDPTLSQPDDLTMDEDASEQTVNLTGITAGGGETQPLRVTASSNNTNLVPNPTVTYTSDETSGSIKFTPITDATGGAVITVSVEDGGSDGDLSTSGDNATTSQTFTLTVNAVNDLPTLAAISDLTIDEDAPERSVSLFAITAGGGESQLLRVTATSSNTDLIASLSVIYTSAESTGSITFTPLADANGSTVITVTVEDGGLDGDLATSSDNATSSETFTVTVAAVDDPPRATAGSYQPNENELLTVTPEGGLTQFSSDPDGDALTFSLVSGTAHGQLVLAANGSFTYQPDTNFNRTDSFRYVANDGTTDSNEATVTLSINTDYPWHNAFGPTDVTDDGYVHPLDALRLINKLNKDGSTVLSKSRSEGLVAPFYDVNHDGTINSADAVTVIDEINETWQPTVQVQIQATDENGSPITEVNEGEVFWIIGSLTDLRPDGKGVLAAYYDIQFPDHLMNVNGPAVFASPYVKVPRMSSKVGLVDEIGSRAGNNELNTDKYEHFRLPMKATSAGIAIVTTDPAEESPDHDILVYNNDGVVITDRQTNYGSFTLTILADQGDGEGESLFDWHEFDRSLTPLPASRLSLSDWTTSRSSVSAPVAVVERDLERPRVSASQLSWQRQVDDAIVDLTGEEEELLLGDMDDLADSIDGLL